MAARAPVDVRVNTLKTDRARVLKALAPFHPEPLGFPPDAVRLPAPAASERAAPVEATPEFEKGWFEVQDLGSQIAAAAAGEITQPQVLGLLRRRRRQDAGAGRGDGQRSRYRWRTSLYAYGGNADARRHRRDR